MHGRRDSLAEAEGGVWGAKEDWVKHSSTEHNSVGTGLRTGNQGVEGSPYASTGITKSRFHEKGSPFKLMPVIVE